MFVFDINLNNKNEKALILFSGHLEGDELQYSYLFERWFGKQKVKPDQVVFLFPDFISENLLPFFKEASRCRENICRFGEDTGVLLFSFDKNGELKKEIVLNRKKLLLEETLNLNKLIIKNGILHLAQMNRNEVILSAPPGTIFKKPSEDLYSEFIKASGLTNNASENQFIAFSLLTVRPKQREIRTILIDSSSIAMIAQAVQIYLNLFSIDRNFLPDYRTFGSYEGMTRNKPDNTENLWVIISASTSNNLGKKLAVKWSIQNDQIITLLSYKDSNNVNGDSSLINISSLSNNHKEDKDASIHVRMVGENFTAEVKEPKSVLLKAKHAPASIEHCIKPFIKYNTFKCNKRNPNRNLLRPVFIDSEYVLENDSFIKWLKKVVEWMIPANTKWIVYDDMNPSGLAFQKLVSKFIAPLKTTAISFKDIKNNISGEEAVVILTPVISSGHILQAVNRDLRAAKHTGNRIFLCAFATTPTEAKYQSLKRSLERAPDNFKYSFLSFFKLNIGEIEGVNPWELERKVVSELEGDFWEKRLEILNKQAEGLNGELCCCPQSDISKKLSLTQDFVFWDGWIYDVNQIDSEAVFLTIAAVLEELRNSNDNDSLQSHVYQQAVLDPDNFSRFNDGLIQSCLWRAARDTETDYRGSDVLSSAMSSIILTLIKSEAQSVTDILLGIACGKIKLTDKSLQFLLEHTLEYDLVDLNRDLISYIRRKIAKRTTDS